MRENRKSFIDSIKHESNKDNLLRLQGLFESGEIKEEDLTEEQKEELSKLYDKQINMIKYSNELKRRKLEKYKKNAQNV